MRNSFLAAAVLALAGAAYRIALVRAARDCNRQGSAERARRHQNIRIEAALGHPGRIEANEEKVTLPTAIAQSRRARCAS